MKKLALAFVLVATLIMLGGEVQRGILAVIALVGILWVMIFGFRWQRRRNRSNNHRS